MQLFGIHLKKMLIEKHGDNQPRSRLCLFCIIVWLSQFEFGKIPGARAHLSNSMLAANQSLWHFSVSKHLSEQLQISIQILWKFKIGIYLRFVPCHSVHFYTQDIKHPYHHVCNGLGPTKTMCRLLKFGVWKDEHNPLVCYRAVKLNICDNK